jgi:hypothetical protein
MPLDAIVSYVEKVVSSFSDFNPVYIISGDTDFGSQRTTEYYLTALQTIKRKSPKSLTTMHIWGDSTEIPPKIVENDALDFYMYQSGHRKNLQNYPYEFAQNLYHQTVKRPILNGEPCYEGGGFYPEYGRFTRFDVRKAIWQSLLSGAKAGVTYGAQGLWSWQQSGDKFGAEGAFGPAYTWRTALRLEGAWDASFAKWIFKNYHLFDLEPRDLIINDTEEIRAASSSDLETIVIYIPYSTHVRVNRNLEGYSWTLINLADRHFGKPIIITEGDTSIIEMHEFNSDHLVIGVREM